MSLSSRINYCSTHSKFLRPSKGDAEKMFDAKLIPSRKMIAPWFAQKDFWPACASQHPAHLYSLYRRYFCETFSICRLMIFLLFCLKFFFFYKNLISFKLQFSTCNVIIFIITLFFSKNCANVRRFIGCRSVESFSVVVFFISHEKANITEHDNNTKLDRLK